MDLYSLQGIATQAEVSNGPAALMHNRAFRTWTVCRHTRVSEPCLQRMTSNSVLSHYLVEQDSA